jgi:hypothetical protein
MAAIERAQKLWRCPRCRQTFVTRNMWHSCVRSTPSRFFEQRNRALKPLYRQFVTFVRRAGPITVNVTKTRIAFQQRARFAGVAGTTKDALICSFWLKRRIHSSRFLRVEFIPPNNYVYQFRLKNATELDREVECWIREAYEVGAQRYAPADRQNRQRPPKD